VTAIAAAAAAASDEPVRAVARVLVGSESAVLRAGMHALLRGQDWLEIVGLVQQLERLPQQAALTSAQAALLAPTHGVATAQDLLREQRVPCRCVLLVPPAAIRVFGAELRERGVQCLPLTADPARIVLALRKATSSVRHLVAVESLSRGVGGRLTRREQEVVERLARGQTNARIAADLSITEETVKAHLTSIYRKLGVANRATAIATYLGAL
jgi:DNA-binding NarL/FixJ family response regulator